MNRRSRSLTSVLVAGIVAGVLFLLIAANLLTLTRLDSYRKQAFHARQLQTALDGALRAMIDAETGQRGFLLTAKPEYLVPFQRGEQELSVHLDEVLRLTAGDPSQQGRIAEVRLLCSQKLAELHNTIELRQRGQAEAALGVMNSDEGRRLMERLREVITHMRTDEEGVMTKRRSAVDRVIQIALVADGIAGVALLPLGVLLLRIGRDLAYREALEQRLRAAVTSAEESRAALAASELNFRTLINTVPMLAWTARADGWIDFYNQRWYEYTGTTLEQMQGWGWQTVHDPVTLPQVMARWTASISSGEPFEMSFPLRRADGAFRWHLTRIQPIRDADGLVTRWFGANTDIDDQLRSERQMAEAVRIRDEFLSIASHELRTPLSTLRIQIEGLMRSLKKGALPLDRLGGKIELAATQVDRLERLVTTLLDVSLMEAGHLKLEIGEVDLAILVRGAVAALTDAFERAGCAVTVVAERPVLGAWDHDRIDQVVTNLLTNAAKYGGGKPITVTVEDDGDKARLWVKDQGIGISRESQERIFGRFERAADARHFAGLGLGLWLAKQIVEAHGGTMSVASELGAGATFTVQLPMRVP